MKTTKFQTNKKQWLKDCIFDLLIIYISILITQINIYFYPITCLIIAGRLNALGVICHDICHQPLKKNSKLDYILEFLAGYIVNTSVSAMAYHHLNHHRFSNTEKDPYFDGAQRENFLQQLKFILIRGFLLSFGWWLRPYFAFFIWLNPKNLKLKDQYAKIFLRELNANPTLNEKLHQKINVCIEDDKPILVFSLLMLALTLLGIDEILYFYYIPLVICGFFSIMRLIAEHPNEIATDLSRESILRVTKDNHLDFISRTFITPHQIGLHVAHHLYPTEPYFKLESISQKIRDNNEQTI